MKRRRRIRAKAEQGRRAIYYQDGENHFLGGQDVALEMRSGKQLSTRKKTNQNVKKEPLDVNRNNKDGCIAAR